MSSGWQRAPAAVREGGHAGEEGRAGALGYPCPAVFRVFTATSVLRVLLDVEDAVSFAHEPLHPQVLSLVPGGFAITSAPAARCHV